HIALSDMEDSQLDQAGTTALRQNRQFMPSPGELREMAALGGVSLEVRTDTAWLEFDRAVSSYGADYSVSFQDGLINAAVRSLGGWVWCCTREGDAYHVWLRKA